MADVYKEFDTVRRKEKIANFQSASVTRKYAFEIKGIPAEAEYLKVKYGFDRKSSFMKDL